MRSLRLLIAQLAPRPHDVDANVATVVRLLEEYPDADLACFPELFLHGYTLPGIDRIALGPDDEPVRRIRQAAAASSTAVITGFAERLPGAERLAGAERLPGEGAPGAARPANSALLVDADGSLAGIYRKVNLFGGEVDYFTPGGHYVVAGLLGLRVAPLICYDIEFPEPARTVALAGAELLVTLSANMAPYLFEHELFARVRAVENRRLHVYVNRAGIESGLVFLAGSCVVTAAGEVPAALGDGEEVALVDVVIGPAPQPDYLADRRPGVPAVVVPSCSTTPSIGPHQRPLTGGAT